MVAILDISLSLCADWCVFWMLTDLQKKKFAAVPCWGAGRGVPSALIQAQTHPFLN